MDAQCLNKAKREKNKELTIKAVETGKEKAAPASGDGEGAMPMS